MPSSWTDHDVALSYLRWTAQARPPDVSDQWVDLVYAEFYAEGDADKAAGRPVNPLHDRVSNSIPESQVGFIGYACGPLFAGALLIEPY